MQDVLEPTADPGWVLEEHGYDPLRESSIEARFAIGNGFLGVRGARAVSRGPMWVSWQHTLNWASWPRTYVAGLFDTPNAEPPVPALVPAADWLRVRVLLNGKALLRRSGDTLWYHRILDMRRGALITDWRQREPGGVVVRVQTLRAVSQSERTIGLQLLRLEVEQGGVDVALEALFEGAGLGLEILRLEQDLGVWRTEQSGKGLAMAGSPGLQLDAAEIAPRALDQFKWSWNWTTVPGQVASFQRLVAIVRSDDLHEDPGSAARDALGKARQLGWRGVLGAHEAAWVDRWYCSDLEIEGDDAAQQALRFSIYHLNSAANPADERVSIGARALTGDSYLGHVFWDTDIYLVPFYVATWPEAARALLMYRHNTLPGARAKAARMGWRGAMYAWESTDNGEETTPEQIMGPEGKMVQVLCGTQEQHISADVAYAVWHYWQATGDDTFLLDAGGEIVLETARFWASRAVLEADGHCHIRGVIGPDEYHETIDDNAYTNIMARWNIRRGLDIATLMVERWPARWADLVGRLGLDDAELQLWREAAAALVTGFDPKTGLIEQFAGFFKLEEIDLSSYAGRTAPMDVVLGRERTQRSQVLKQADVVALMALLPDEFDLPAKVANFRYYEPRCGHGSSLSRAMHAIVAARLGETDMALRYFRETAATDLTDTAGGSAGGVHIAALGGLWQAALFGFAGLSLRADVLALDPRLPLSWRSFGFRVHWRGRVVKVRVDQGSQLLAATLEAGEPMTLVVSEEPHALRPRDTLRIGFPASGEAGASL
ncbi:MAG TPA: glycosyl hydrolase family 65 protein [Acetobacteraceae bacterium]|jgi:trehalose/maltose hydrolase-like predicted phosphorylase|nr:glycosyl hydrolase family 65 protein [Acetobacteraceae bacterium]